MYYNGIQYYIHSDKIPVLKLQAQQVPQL